MCDKVNGVKTFKNLVYYIMLAHKSYITYVAIYIADWLVKLGPLKLYWFSAVYYHIPLEGYQTMCVRSFSFANGQKAFESMNQSAVYIQWGRITEKEHLLIRNSGTTQKVNTYLYNYQTETAIFVASYKTWTNNYDGMQIFKLFKKYFLHFELLTSTIIKMKVFI